MGVRAADYGLTEGQQDFLEWVRRVAADLADVDPVHGAVNRPLVSRLGELGLLRALYGGNVDEPPTDAAAMQQERVILGAFSLGADLPTGPTRVARVHVMVSGEGRAEYTVSLTTAATSGGKKIGASAEVRRGEDQ